MSKNYMPTNYSKYTNLGDFHTHSIYSYHALSSPSEMIEAARKRGLKYLAITDHFYPYPFRYETCKTNDGNPGLRKFEPLKYHTLNQRAILDEIQSANSWLDDITVLAGYEYNFFDTKNDLAHNDTFNLIGLHNWFKEPSSITYRDYLYEIIETITGQKSYIYNCIAHPEREVNFMATEQGKDALTQTDLVVEIVKVCKRHNIPIEINESSISSRSRYSFAHTSLLELFAQECIEKRVPMIVNSDAHSIYQVGNVSNAFELLDNINCPADLIVNFDEEKIKQFILHK